MIRLYSWGNVGDAILTTPGIRALKQQHPADDLIVYCAKPSHEKVFANNPNIHCIKTLTKLIVFIHRLIRAPIHSAPIGNVRPGILYDKEAAIIAAEMLDVHIADTTPELFVTKTEVATVAEIVNHIPRPRVAIHAISTDMKKNWTVASWEEVVRRIRPCRFLQVGAAGEPRISGTVDFTGKDLRLTFALLRECDALVAVDSAMAHAAAAFGVPAVVLFGASSPKVYGHRKHMVVSRDVGCTPCLELLFGDPCPFGNRCMHAITPVMVCEALTRILEGSYMEFGGGKL